MATRRTTAPAKAKSNTATKARKTTRKLTKKTMTPSYDVIAERAWCIWMDNGCQPGQEEHNWLKAETQLKTELVTC